MAYVPKCVYDVFLSYAHLDNLPIAGERWVDRFKKELEDELRRELAVCVGEKRFVVWQDTERLKTGYSLNQSLQEALGKTAIVLSLYSPGYLASGYCADERGSFQRQCGDAVRLGASSRLMNVIIRSSDDVVRLAATEDLFASLATPAGPLTIGSDAFRSEFVKLVSAVKTLLERLRQQFPKVYVALTGAGADPKAAASVAKEIEGLLEDLSHAGYARTTEIHPGFYSDFQLEHEIRGAKASVHLVADPFDPLTRRQIEAACRADVPVLVWLAPPAAQGSGLEWIRRTVHGRQREYSTGPFSTFCERVRHVLQHADERPVNDPARGPMKTVFVVRHPRFDRDGAEVIRRRIEARGVAVTYEMPGWNALDGVLVYHRKADDDWFATKLRFVANAPVVRAACTVPPPDKSKALQAAQDYLFMPIPAVNVADPRILLEGDDQHHLQPFVQAVLGA
jgi:hypothetical protein